MDSRVTSGSTAKGRSSAGSVNWEMRKLLPDIFGGDRLSQLSWILYLNDEFDGGAEPATDPVQIAQDEAA